MKRWLSLLAVMIGVLGLFGCQRKEEDILHLGLNAEIIEIDTDNHLLYVKDADEISNGVFGGKSAIDCQSIIEREKIFYVNYSKESSSEVEIIQFQDLQVGDRIILGIYESEFNNVEPMAAEQLQLAAQRLN